MIEEFAYPLVGLIPFYSIGSASELVIIYGQMKNKLNKIRLKPGLYVLAVSGGVDSMTLLDLLAGRFGVELIVAHFNHGIRDDAIKDEILVSRTAKKLGLVFEAGHGDLGFSASEDQARQARYDFLEEVRDRYGARAIVMAHHQGDLIETAIINVLRGSGRRGLSAIKNNPRVLRPLIDVPKDEVVAYANTHKLRWLDDSTNQDPKYLRNYVRLKLLPKLTEVERDKLIQNIDKVAKNKSELDELIATLSHSIIKNNQIDRSKFAVLPPELTQELMSSWLRQLGLSQLDRKTVERLCLGLKTARPGTKLIADKNLCLDVAVTSAHFSNR
jgi:tRNA(Ile)-lysidine synthase